jgi:foldase protein PrsA
MGFLITGYWYQGTAHKLGIKLTDAQLQQAITKAKTASGIKTAAAYKTFLGTSGYTDEDINYRIRISTLYSKLLKRHPMSVSDAQIASYYNAHKSSYGSAEKLNLRMVLAKTQANANAAKSALKSGQSWDTIAKKYSIDPNSKNSGGLLTGITANQEDAALSKAAFAAPLNQLQGPVKGQFGYYVFEVLKQTPATQETLKQATPAIKKTLTTANQTAAATAVNTQAASQWKSSTVCSKLFATTDCSNYVKPKTTASATAPTTTPAPTVTSKAGAGKSSPKSSTTSSSSSK